jgi:hypothetical protein
LAAQAARRAATTALLIHPAPDGYVEPTLLGTDAGAADGADTDTAAAGSAPDETVAAGPPIPPVYAIAARFAQLTAVNVEVGAVNELGLRFKTAYETPAENSYIYASKSC